MWLRSFQPTFVATALTLVLVALPSLALATSEETSIDGEKLKAARAVSERRKSVASLVLFPVLDEAGSVVQGVRWGLTQFELISPTTDKVLAVSGWALSEVAGWQIRSVSADYVEALELLGVQPRAARLRTAGRIVGGVGLVMGVVGTGALFVRSGENGTGYNTVATGLLSSATTLNSVSAIMLTVFNVLARSQLANALEEHEERERPEARSSVQPTMRVNRGEVQVGLAGRF